MITPDAQHVIAIRKLKLITYEVHVDPIEDNLSFPIRSIIYGVKLEIILVIDQPWSLILSKLVYLLS